MPLSLPAFRREVYDEYFRILDYWEKYSLDNQNGGFYGHVNSLNQPDENAPKAIVINSRILWSFSTAYIHFKQKHHLTIAERAYDYILKYFVDKEYGGVYWSVNTDGTPLETKKQMYGNAFAVYGTSEFYRATKRKDVLKTAIDIYQNIEKHSFDPINKGYLEAFNRDWSQTDEYILCRGESRKSMNTHLHLFEAFANLYRVWHDKQSKAQFKGILEVMMQQVIDNQSFRMTLFFDEKWKHLTETISYGHDIEASWLLWESAELLNDKKLKAKAKDLCINMAKAACDGLGKDNIMNYEYEPKENALNDIRSWWVMTEACVGFMNAYQLTGKVHFLEKSTQTWEYIKKHFLDLENGEWFGNVKPDGTVTFKDKITFWKGPYHNSRMCLEIWKRLG